jgi:ribonucleoside-diphosphate reductase alpha chain
MEVGMSLLYDEVPFWMGEESLEQFKKSALPNESPLDAYTRIAGGNEKLLEYLYKGWICPSTPVLANYNTDRGLPISCFGSTPEDSLDGIFETGYEIARLTKSGGGTSVNMSNLRGRGKAIRGNGTSNGVVAWCKLYDTIIDKVRQGNVRRGAVALYVDAYHSDFEEFLRIRRPEGDVRNQCLDTNIAISISDAFMDRLIKGGKTERDIWQKILKERLETGEPYIFFEGNANKDVNFPNFPEYKVSASNLCSEIMLHSDTNHTFVCCLSSLNLAKYDEWKDTDVVEVAITLLDDVMEEFIKKAKKLAGLDKAVRFAEKSRALGLGVLGWHTLCQKNLLPIGSRVAAQLNLKIFKQLRRQSYEASTRLAEGRGVPEWCEGLDRRNSHLLAVAPTFSNSIVSGFVSEGVNPISSNAYMHRSSKRSFVRRNKELEELKLLTEHDWDSVVEAGGSIQHLDLDPLVKNVFKTAKEINQLDLITLAGTRQKYIDQGQSVNIYCTYDVPKHVFNMWHLEAYSNGLKALYYVRSSAALKGDVVNYSKECEACSG